MRWETISINFVVELLKFVGFDMVITMVDLVFETTHFILTHTTVSIEEAVRLFLHFLLENIRKQNEFF